MNLGKMLRSRYAVDDYASATPAASADIEEATVLAMASSAPVAAVETAPVVVEKIVYVDKVVEKVVEVEKPVYVDRVVEVEKIVEVPAKAEADSAFFEDYIPSDWAEQKSKANA